jgi:transcriptional regulator with XRE-family HTH domain
LPDLHLGAAVRELREKRAFSQEEFAKEAGIKLDTLKALESGRRTSRHATIRAVAKALGLPPEVLQDYAAREGQAAATEHGEAVAPSDEHPLYRRLTQITRITVDRTNVVREAGAVPAITLADGLYVRRDVEDEIFASLIESEAEWPTLGQQAGGARMRSGARIALGTETGPDGRPIGRDPRKMGPDELRTLGHAPITPTAAIRAHCLDCCGGSSAEMRKCTAVRCPSWPFRTGANPWRAPLSEAERARRRERIARVAKRAGNSPPPEKSRGVDAASPSAPIPAAAAETSEP